MFTSIIDAIANWFTIMETGMSINDTFYGIEGMYDMFYVIRTFDKWHALVPWMLVALIAVAVLVISVAYCIANWEDDEETEELTVA